MKRQLSRLYRSVLLGLCFPLANYLVSLPTHDLPWGPLLGAHTHTVLSQDGSWSEGFWEVQDSFIMAWHYPLTSDPQGAFLCTCSVSFVQKRWEQRSLNPSLKQNFAPFVLAMTSTLTIAMTLTLGCLQETKTGYLPCFCCYFHFWGQTGGWL